MPQSHLRAADSDRETVAAELGRHMTAGRLTVAEYDERLAQVYAARTYGDLDELTADLPGTVAAPVPGPSPATVAPWTSHGLRHGSPEHSERAWLATSGTVLVVYLVIALASWELAYFWPMWVIGPWGAVLLAQRVTGAGATTTGAPRPGR